MAQNKPRTTVFAVIPDFENEGKFQLIAEGSAIGPVRLEAQAVVERRHGRFWTTAWRHVFVGLRSDILVRCRLRDQEFQQMLKMLRKSEIQPVDELQSLSDNAFDQYGA